MIALRLRFAVAAVAMLGIAASNAADLNASVVDGKGQPLGDAVVYLVPSQPMALPAAKRVVIDQVDKEFVPRVTVVQTGARVDFPNNDNIRHQVYSFSPAKTFELKLYSGRPSSPVVFDKSGVAVLGCNIHDHMIAWVISVDTPWFARTDASGKAHVGDLPAGKYEMLVWHPGMAQPLSQGYVDNAGAGTLERAVRIEVGTLVGANQVSSAHHAHH